MVCFGWWDVAHALLAAWRYINSALQWLSRPAATLPFTTGSYWPSPGAHSQLVTVGFRGTPAQLPTRAMNRYGHDAEFDEQYWVRSFNIRSAPRQPHQCLRAGIDLLLK
jgi:hypothetical protein